MKIIIWELPERELTHLKRNCEKEFAEGKICMHSDKQVEAGICAGEKVVVSQNRPILAACAKAGMVTVAYQPPKMESLQEKCISYPDSSSMEKQSFPQVDIIVEGFEEVDYDFLKKIYERHHGIPWTILETERLFVRELALSDLEALMELYAYEGMTDYMEGLYAYEEEYRYQKAYIENMYRFFGYGMWLVFEKETGKLVGRAGVEHREELEGALELGYAIGTPWQGKGYATEVCRAILTYVREQLGFEEICSLVQPENLRSVHLLEKLGFFLEKDMVLEEMTYKKYKKYLE